MLILNHIIAVYYKPVPFSNFIAKLAMNTLGVIYTIRQCYGIVTVVF